ncbi:MFS transporter [Pararhodobacter sp. SW119]|uniref:MFS transporter n=1 Tax=Pararhodobacter sp. SW119 TaxID=2780075 RepID=UPI001ADEBF99|nr:MFS transporter [Pararhodobacter sp. SW119]
MPSRLPVVFILVTLTLDAIGFGLILPVMPDLLVEVTGRDLSHAALWAGMLTGGFAVMQFFCGPVIGGLSDRFGRKPVLLLSLAVLSADYLILALAGTIWLVFAARLLTGAASSTQATAVAYLADISTPEEKAQRFGLVGAAFGVGFVLGPAIGGLLAEFGTRAPFVVASALAAANMAFGAIVLRETLHPQNRRPFRLRRANPFAAFGHIGRFRAGRRLLAVYFLHEFGFFVYPVVWAYFSIARFGWSPGQVGFSLALFGLCFAVVQAGLIRPALNGLGRQGAMIAGTLAGIVSFSGLAVVGSGALALALVPVAALGGFVVPALRAELSDRVGADRQGELQGLMASLRAVGMMAAPLVFTQVFAKFTGSGAVIELPGAPFAIAALLNLVALVILTRRD